MPDLAEHKDAQPLSEGALAPIGIVIPAYGHPRFLGEAIISACTQETARQIYVVVVDDGCRFEETAELVANLMGQFPGVLHYVRHKNTRLPGARNKGVRFLMAMCPEIDSVFFLDADNRLSPYSIEAYRKALGDDERIGWAYPDIAFFGLSWGRGGFDIRETAPEYSVLKHLCGNISEAGSLVRASLFRNDVFFDDTMRSGFEDWDFWLTALGAGYLGVRVKDAGFLYRRRAESMLADSRREEELLLARMKIKHKALFDPRFMMQTVQREAPFFAILEEGSDKVLLTADPCARPAELTLAEFANLMAACRKSPREHFFPRKILLFAPGVWQALLKSAPAYLRWVFWMVLREKADARAISVAEAARPSIHRAQCSDYAHILALESTAFEHQVWTGDMPPLAEFEHLALLLPITGVPEVAHLGPLCEGIGALLPKGKSFMRHTDRRYAGPHARGLYEKVIDPACSADDEFFPPAPWVRTDGEKWFAFVAVGDEVADHALAQRMQAVRAKGYRVLLILEREDGVSYNDEAALALEVADMVVPLVLEPSAGMSRYYLGRRVKSVMTGIRQLELETLAIHFDHIEASYMAMSLEAFGASKHRGAKTHLLMPGSLARGAGVEDYGRVLAYEHAIDQVVTDDPAVLAGILSAQGIPREKVVAEDEFFRALSPASAKAMAPVVMAKPLGWAPPDGYLFVVTYGRSGSTLLQTVLQSIDGYFIRGENENALYPLFEAWQRAQSVRQRFDTTRPVPKHGPWFGADEVDAEAFAARLVDAFVAEVIRPPENARVVGFKEIRYGDLSEQELETYLEFIARFFPQSRFIFNMRKAEDVGRSGWWKDVDAGFVENLVSRNDAAFKRFAARNEHRCHLMQYEDYTKDVSGFRPLFDFLGEEMDEASLTAMMARQLDH
ncbi:glycosyltransferase [Kordiimonas sp.]|uniref:glycosyltransferase n=1 Tax=Kordiimonas sp. TaxID=1970157 RepID=UPI003A8D1413